MLNRNQSTPLEQAEYSSMADQAGLSQSVMEEIRQINRQSGHISLQQLDGTLIWFKRREHSN